MTDILIRNLHEEVETRIRERAAEHECSIEEEVHYILHEALNIGITDPRDLAEFTRELFAPVGGVELELPPRGPMRKLPNSS